MKTFQDFSPYNGLYWKPNGSRSKRQSQCKMNKCFFVSFGSFNERNERIDSGKDSRFVHFDERVRT